MIRGEGLKPMEIDAIVERLDQHGTLLRDIRDHLARLNGKVAEVEKWQAATDPVVESMIERIDETSDKTEAHQTYIDQQKGGATMKLQLASGIVTVIGMLVMGIKLLFFHS